MAYLSTNNVSYGYLTPRNIFVTKGPNTVINYLCKVHLNKQKLHISKYYQKRWNLAISHLRSFKNLRERPWLQNIMLKNQTSTLWEWHYYMLRLFKPFMIAMMMKDLIWTQESLIISFYRFRRNILKNLANFYVKYYLQENLIDLISYH